jgi:uncharacterized protein YyaL (SSP411 family)
VKNFFRKAAAVAQIAIFVLSTGAQALELPDSVDTSRLPPDGGDRYNRLIFEKSPYLLLHATNPVDWYPWGEEAFTRARREGKPILLSIGYSTCHWCHVMEEESFANAEIAAVINEHYVAIKVDREERPDIDRIYIIVSEILTGHSGWPLNVLLTPDRKPFYAMTYLPPETRGGRPGLAEVLTAAAGEWRENRRDLTEAADRITEALARIGGNEEGREPGTEVLEAGYKTIAGRFDEEHAGFLPAPKFPRPHMYGFLFRYSRRTGEEKAGRMALRTLRALRLGGIYDQLGGGFHRYATDRQYLVPHFEKMLYDQALLALSYIEAWQVTKEPFFADTAREIVGWVERDLAAPDGGYFSAVDADSEGEEGKFYVWPYAELLEVLGEKRGRRAAQLFNARPEGNYREEATGREVPLNILHLTEEPPADDWFREARQSLLERRGRRPPPLMDDKIITSWNGLMIAALARGGGILGEDVWIRSAEGAARFLLEKMKDSDGRLLRRYRDGEAALPGYLEDYAFLTWGFIELYEATLESEWLAAAVQMNTAMIDLFGGDHGAFTFSGKGNEVLVAGAGDSYDGALPSGNSVAALNILRLGRLTGNKDLEKRAGSLFAAFGAALERSPAGHTMMLSALDFHIGPSRELVVAGDPGSPDVTAMIDLFRRDFRPNTVILLRPPGEKGAAVAKLAPYTEFMTSRGGRATAYLCENFTCKDPMTDLDSLENALP